MLNWVPDEFLVRPEMYERVFRPFRIPSRPVLDYESQAVLRTVVQLVISLRADVGVANATYQTCGSCGARSYDRDPKSYAPTPLSAPGPLFKSTQWFSPFHSIRLYDPRPVSRHRGIRISRRVFHTVFCSGTLAASARGAVKKRPPARDPRMVNPWYTLSCLGTT
jgi:hypothetical protein